MEFVTKERMKQEWDAIAKPLDSLGKFEGIISQLGVLQNNLHPKLDKSALLIFCSDNGIVEEGISQSDQEVTKICARNIAQGLSTVGIMAKRNACELKVYDVGMNTTENIENITTIKCSLGTKNFIKEKAMTKEEYDYILQQVKNIVKECKESGVQVLCVGEMGIGNTTTSTAVACSILKKSPKELTGRGAGLDDSGLIRKICVIEQAIAQYDLYNSSVEEILCSVSGYDIVSMVGVYLAAKEYSMPVILDGAISLVAALAAYKLDPDVLEIFIPSHTSKEPLCQYVCKELGLSPMLQADMALGEGTGAILVLELLKTMIEVYEQSLRFEKSGVQAYSRYGEEA